MSDGSEIVRVAARGEGVSADGRFAAFAAPGDRLLADGRLEPGPHHLLPPCRHFPECGGCQLQHLDGASYAGFVRDRIAGALAAQGIAAPEFALVHLSPPNTRRRASLRAERRGRRVLIGFNEEKSRRVVDMRECHILAPELFALVEPLRQLLAPMLPERRAAGVRMTLADQGVDLLLDGVEADGLAAAEALTAFAQANGLARLAVDGGFGPEVRWEPQPVTVTLGRAQASLPLDAFLQATRDGEAALIAAVQTAVGEAYTVADLFAGIGTFALNLPASRIYAGEASRDAMLALKRAAPSIFTEHRDLYRRPLTTAELDRFEAVVLDPPRAGAQEQVRQLAASHAPKVAYVSCNPNSFARDAKLLLEGGYRLERVTPVGQFRWSTHVELAAAFAR